MEGLPMKLYAMEWYESERGWGRRPDGFSLHATHEDFDGFMAIHWTGMPAQVPDEYEAPEWEHPRLVEAPEALGALVEKLGSLRIPHRCVELSGTGLKIFEPRLEADAQAALVEKRVAEEKACLEKNTPEGSSSRPASRI
jgi:hypothetical protein